jgi:hypothetical protein
MMNYRIHALKNVFIIPISCPTANPLTLTLPEAQPLNEMISKLLIIQT